MWTLAWLHLFGIGFDIYICCPYYFCWQYFYILHIYAVNTTTSSLKSAGISEVNSVPSPSCTVQGTFTSNVANAIFFSEHWIAKDFLSFCFEEWIGTECITFSCFVCRDNIVWNCYNDKHSDCDSHSNSNNYSYSSRYSNSNQLS